ncbi:hypothetical protein YDYSG_54850 [Paenibacillus tyrfis]|uniref:DUF5071 domain-containing protein n=1 Tax=Paenibacillus tyrfis TaxID=1501230 RepID=UPI00248FEB02|nr:DUF5071 domain-containing protein [Paenibacillus tyrfis]GLI09453.1 hypothetical protein YDYSG_54850 [Paenibacillus tyrfis]
MDIDRSLVPRNKFDFETVDLLKKLPPEKLKPALPQLFEWIQDINWPIARDIAKILVSCGCDTLTEIKKILRTPDEEWKLWCLEYVVRELPKDLIVELQPELEKTAYAPTRGEKVNELDTEARQILSLISKKPSEEVPQLKRLSFQRQKL